MDLTVDKRERLVELLTSEYTVPEEYIDCVIAAVKQYATKNYSDEVIEKMVRTPQSLSNGKNDLSLFRGIISEWLVCSEYNALKNKGAVIMTITNPDPSSKADLLHIINTGEGFIAVPGPDVKSGGSTYVFNQWKKIVNERYEIPMVDIDGILTTEEGLKQLTQKQRAEFEELRSQFPNKRPLETVFDKSDVNRVVADYLKYVEFDVLPSEDSQLSIKDISISSIRVKLYSGTISVGRSYDWQTYVDESSRILLDAEVTNVRKAKDKVVEREVAPQQQVKVIPQQKVKKNNSLFSFVPPKVIDGGKAVVKSIRLAALKGVTTVFRFAVEHPEVVYTIIDGISEYNAIKNEGIETYESDETDEYYSSTYYDYDWEDETQIEKSLVLTQQLSNEVEQPSETIIEDVVSIVNMEDDNVRVAHASKHVRKLPDGWKASPEKIATSKENGFDLKEGETWVDNY